MNSRWKQYLLYTSLIIIGGSLIYLLVETLRVKNTGFETKTLWDWMELLIIPLVLASGAFYLNRSERALERRIAEDRAKLEREIATDRQQETALQSYLDRMAELLLKEKLRTTKKAEVRDVARIRTLTVMRILDAKRKGLVIKFLYEAKLINRGKVVIDLDGADLKEADLQDVNLENARLEFVNLENANLSFANLSGVLLHGANMRNAELLSAYLREADLRSINLLGANLIRANLQGANLQDATLHTTDTLLGDLIDAGLNIINVKVADLRYANLNGTNLTGAKVSVEQLATAKSLKDATMPDGTKHE